MKQNQGNYSGELTLIRLWLLPFARRCFLDVVALHNERMKLKAKSPKYLVLLDRKLPFIRPSIHPSSFLFSYRCMYPYFIPPSVLCQSTSLPFDRGPTRRATMMAKWPLFFTSFLSSPLLFGIEANLDAFLPSSDRSPINTCCPPLSKGKNNIASVHSLTHAPRWPDGVG